MQRTEDLQTAGCCVQVFALWFASGPHQPEFAGVHVFFFDKDLKIDSVAAFREAFEMERKTQLQHSR